MQNGLSVTSVDPATGEVVFRAAQSTGAQVDAAIARSRAAGREWSRGPESGRADVLRRFADLIEREQVRLAGIISAEVGKRIQEARDEVAWTALSARWYAGHPPTLPGGDGYSISHRPLGIIAAITPWNVPVVTPSWKWLPALMAGNTVLWKPSEVATWSATVVLELLREAGLPDDVMQLIVGDAVQATQLVRDHRVAGIHFTGSTDTGRVINAAAAPRLARVALELGGSNPAVVFADADLDRATGDIVASSTAINGQKCTAVRRVLVHESIAGDMVSMLSAAFLGLTVGDPTSPDTDVGPLIHGRAARKANDVVEAALGLGARIAAQAAPPISAPVGSSYFPPTILTDVPVACAGGAIEVFAPIVTVQSFSSAGQAFELANSSDYGLAAAVYTRDGDLVRTSAREINSGIVNVNRRCDAVGLDAPFGGRGASGNGFPEGGAHVYRALTDIQVVYQPVLRTGADDEAV